MLTCGEVDVKQICFRTSVQHLLLFIKEGKWGTTGDLFEGPEGVSSQINNRNNVCNASHQQRISEPEIILLHTSYYFCNYIEVISSCYLFCSEPWICNVNAPNWVKNTLKRNKCVRNGTLNSNLLSVKWRNRQSNWLKSIKSDIWVYYMFIQKGVLVNL